MLDNKKLGKFAMTNFRFLPYETKIDIFDKNCGICPHKILVTINRQNKPTKFHTDLNKAINYTLFRPDNRLIRGCNFNDEFHSLEEIMINTCRFWKIEYDELTEGEVTEVESEQITCLREIRS